MSHDNDRLGDVRAGWDFLNWHYTEYPITCLFLLAQGLCYALLRLGQAGKLPPEVADVFFRFYFDSALSLESFRDGRYHTLATSVLFMSSLASVAFTWLGLFLILSRLEIRFGGVVTFLLVMLPAIASNAAFLYVSTFQEAAESGAIPAWQARALDLLRPFRATYTQNWHPVPLWLGPAVVALLFIPRARLIGWVPMWLVVAGIVACEFTVHRKMHGQQYTGDGLLAAGLAGVLMAILLAGGRLLGSAFRRRTPNETY